MILVGLVFIFLAIKYDYEPLLLVPIGFGAILSNIPVADMAGPEGLLGYIYSVGIETGVFPIPVVSWYRVYVREAPRKPRCPR